MIDRLISNIVRFNKIWGIHISETPEQVKINAILLRNRKGIVNSSAQYSYNSITQLKSILTDNVPVCLSYSGGNVLTKTTDHDKNLKLEQLLHVSDLTQFYVQSFQTQTKRYLSVIRKEQFDPLLTWYKENKINLVSVVFGPVNILTLLPYLNISINNTIPVGEYSVKCNAAGIDDIVKNNPPSKELEVGSERINSDFLLPYSNAFSEFQPDSLDEFMLSSVWPGLSIEYKHRQFLKKSLPVCMGFILGLLLINFVILQFQTERYNKRSLTLSSYQKQLSQLEEITNDFNDKQQFLGRINLNDYKYYSFYADRLASTLTTNVRLTSLLIFPKVETRLGINKNFSFADDIIKIAGICNSTTELNKWLMELEKLPFIEEINEQVFEYEDYDEKGHFSFSLKVNKP